nr:RNA polymerase-binding protein DksA [uncultured Brevundimonas sp.]
MTDESGRYRPSDDEPFMNERQQAYFKKKLLDWKDDILRESKGTVVNLKAETENHPDLVDRASSESDRALELRTRDRQRKLISKIDDALRRIEDGSYGYCEDTGRTHRLGPSGGPSDRDPVGRGPGTARAPRARPPRRLRFNGPTP